MCIWFFFLLQANLKLGKTVPRREREEKIADIMKTVLRKHCANYKAIFPNINSFSFPARFDQVRQHRDRRPRRGEGHLRRGDEEARLRHGGPLGPALTPVRRADLRAGLVVRTKLSILREVLCMLKGGANNRFFVFLCMVFFFYFFREETSSAAKWFWFGNSFIFRRCFAYCSTRSRHLRDSSAKSCSPHKNIVFLLPG